MLIKNGIKWFLIVSFLWAQTCSADNEFVKRKDVTEFINTLVKKHHFKKPYLKKILGAVKIRSQVIKHLNKPYEKDTWHTYQRLFVTDWRIKNGVKFWKKYETTLKRAEKIYKVPASIIVATIGVETKYGERVGDFRVIDSLSSIGFSDSPRAAYFRKELEEFFLLTREHKLNPLKIMGSYAGAIGQPQFMPSSYRNFAVNFSKSGKTDLMHNKVDIIGSVANYYSKNGWKPDTPIAMEAFVLGDRFHYLLRNEKITLPATILELTKYGVIPKTKIEKEDTPVKVIELKSRYSREYWLGFHNFGVIKRYNSSDLYAMAVFQLSNFIRELKERTLNESKASKNSSG